jgi:hypothetical protein
MKRYKVVVKEKKPSNVILHDGDEISNTEKQLVLKYKMKYPFGVIKITRMKKEPGIQTNIIDAIKENET